MKKDQPTNFSVEIIKLARKAADSGEVPVGAIVVNSMGEIIGRGYNQTHAKRDGLQHAELLAIRQAQKRIGDWRLTGASLYVTLEPCLMCLGAAGNARISKIVYILADPLFGSVESKLTKQQVKKLYPKLGFARQGDDGVVTKLMQEFFRNLRKR